MASKYALEWIGVNDLHESKDNPNTMPEAKFMALVNEMHKYGCLVPLVTRPCTCPIISKPHRAIVGGEHRWRTAQHPVNAMTEIPCIDVDLNDPDAKILMFNLNNLHGDNIPLKLAALFVDLSKTISVDALQESIHLPKDQIIEIMYPKSSIAAPAIPDTEGKEKRQTETGLFTVVLKREDLKAVNAELDVMAKGKKLSRSEAFLQIFHAYKG